MESRQQPLLIAGAGIAGLSAAIALTLAGVPVRVLEQTAGLEPTGAGIQLGPTATRALSEWGVVLGDAVCEPDVVELRNAHTGAALNTLPISDCPARYGARYLTLLRADLQTALLKHATELGISVEYGHRVSGVSRLANGITVTVDGETIEAPGLIGADGLRSTVRAALSAVAPTATGSTLWRALLQGGALPAPYRRHVTVWMGAGAHLVHYPVGAGEFLNAVLAIDVPDRNRAFEGERPSPPQLPNPRWDYIPLAAIAAAASWQPWDLYTTPRHKGGGRYVQLIGDAWHSVVPFLASGAVMAIEDADALGACFKSRQRVIPALEMFRAVRTRRVWRVAAQSRQMGRIYHLAQPAAKARDLAIASTPGTWLLGRNDWLYGYRLPKL